MSIARYYSARLRAQILSGDEPNWLKKHPRRGYIVGACLSYPPWIDREQIRWLRGLARLMTKHTHQVWVLDHIVPINHPLVCGLSVPWNLMVVPAIANARKGNRFPHPCQLDLF